MGVFPSNNNRNGRKKSGYLEIALSDERSYTVWRGGRKDWDVFQGVPNIWAGQNSMVMIGVTRFLENFLRWFFEKCISSTVEGGWRCGGGGLGASFKIWWRWAAFDKFLEFIAYFEIVGGFNCRLNHYGLFYILYVALCAALINFWNYILEILYKKYFKNFYWLFLKYCKNFKCFGIEFFNVSINFL